MSRLNGRPLCRVHRSKRTEVTRERKTSKPITNVPSPGVGPESRAMRATSELEGKGGEKMFI